MFYEQSLTIKLMALRKAQQVKWFKKASKSRREKRTSFLRKPDGGFLTTKKRRPIFYIRV